MPAAACKPRLIVTADDFGLHEAVNEAVERGCRDGVLRAASLMVAAPAVTDAIARARRLPGLAVGLHLVLTDGSALLPPTRIPDLVDASGQFDDAMVRNSFRFLRRNVRRQLADEIRAQFEAFAATGLSLDHVNAHKHFYLHPVILSLVLAIGPAFGMRAMRLPNEPGTEFWLRPWVALMRRRMERAGMLHNDHVFGIRRSGRMDEPALLEAICNLPDGVSELYLHPATRDDASIHIPGYRRSDELAALLSPRVREAVAERCVPCRGFRDPAVAAA
ncbi:MAG: ChbG/HpnK family deacetylase [Rhodanobacteraceae bacterium]|nr:MAG: ChbG/HpnK family deacetylase [Rhodanobacteraceae bacterium]